MKGKEFAIFFHADVDGCVSAANLVSALGARGRGNPDLYPVKNQSGLDNLLRKVGRRYKKIHILDLGSASEKAVLATGAFVTIVDHHEGRKISAKGVIHINPVFDKMPPYPVSYLTWLLYGGRDWQAFVGIVADWGVRLVPDFVGKIWRSYGWQGSQEDLFLNSDPGKIGEAIEAGIIILGEKRGTALAIDSLLASETPRDFLEGKNAPARRLLSCLGKLEAEIAKALEKGSYEETEKLVILRFKAKYPVKREVIQRLKMKKPGKTVFVVMEEKGGYGISARSDGYLLDAIGKYGGGHPHAAGAFVPKKEISKFLWNVRRLFG